MPQWDKVDEAHVISAIEECDALGVDEFLVRYRYKPSRQYRVVYAGREYPSKAILAVAYGRATGHVPGSVQVDGGKFGAARVLRRLGFEVTGDSV